MLRNQGPEYKYNAIEIGPIHCLNAHSMLHSTNLMTQTYTTFLLVTHCVQKQETMLPCSRIFIWSASGKCYGVMVLSLNEHLKTYLFSVAF